MATMIIELDDEQRTLLSALIDNRLSNLPAEIRHTDNRELRQELRTEREVLQGLQSRIAPTPATTAP